MTHRRLASLLAAAVLGLAGCSAAATDDTGASSADVVADDIASRTLVQGTVEIGTKAKLAYEPYEKTKIDGVPYLAWKLVDAPAKAGVETQDRAALGAETAKLSVDLVGDFPGTPDLLVVDADFHVLGSARGKATDLGDEATLMIDATAGDKLVLVRDMEWVRPMSFEISVTR